MKKFHIGDVAVCLGEPPNGNPYGKASLCGDDRQRVLQAFRRDGDAPGYTLWYAPTSGGVRRITPAEVDLTHVRMGACDACGRDIYDVDQILCTDCRRKR